MNLGRFARIRLAHLPTPLEYLPRLSRALRRSGGVDQARRLHRSVERRQQDSQAGISARRKRASAMPMWS